MSFGRLLTFPLLALLAGCATMLQIPRPVLTPVVPPVHEGYSMISLPVTVKLDAVRDLLNARIPPSFAGKGHLEVPLNLLVKTSVGVNYDYQLNRGPVSFTIKGNVVHAAVHFSGTLRGEAAGLFLAQVEIDGDARVDGTVTLLEDWTLSSQLAVATTVTQAELPVGFTVFGQRIGTSVSVRREVQSALDSAKTTISEALNTAIRDVRIKESLQPYWYSLAAPLQVSKNPDVWLTVRPLAIAFSGLSGDGTNLRVGLGTVAQISGSVGLRPPNVTMGPMPSLTRPPQRAAFHIWLPVSVQYAELGNLLSAQLVGHPIQPLGDDAKVMVSQVQLWSRGGLLFVGLKVSIDRPSVTGWIYLQGRLQVDSVAGSISVSDLDFTIETKSGLVNTANTLLHSALATSLSNAINKVLEAEAGTKAEDAAKDGLNLLLQNVRLANGITLRASVDVAHVVGVYGTEAALELDTQFDGSASVTVDLLSF